VASLTQEGVNGAGKSSSRQKVKEGVGMTLAVLIAISVMWLPVAILFLGKGEAKGTGAATGFVGAVVVLSAVLQAAVFKDPFTAGLLFVHGLLYCTVAYALLAGLDDLRSVGNVSLTVAIVSAIYMVIFYTGGSFVDGKPLVAPSNFFAMACAGYTVLTLEVWLNAYGKFPAPALAWSLIVWAFVGLWLPAFSLLATGKLPF
jgi:putative amide transporter protein